MASGAKSPRCRSGRSWTSLSHLIKMFDKMKRSPSYLVGLSLKQKNGHLNRAHVLVAILCCKIRAQGSGKIYPGFYRSVLRFIQFLVPAILSIRNKDTPCFRQVTRPFAISKNRKYQHLKYNNTNSQYGSQISQTYLNNSAVASVRAPSLRSKTNMPGCQSDRDVLEALESTSGIKPSVFRDSNQSETTKIWSISVDLAWNFWHCVHIRISGLESTDWCESNKRCIYCINLWLIQSSNKIAPISRSWPLHLHLHHDMFRSLVLLKWLWLKTFLLVAAMGLGEAWLLAKRHRVFCRTVLSGDWEAAFRSHYFHVTPD